MPHTILFQQVLTFQLCLDIKLLGNVEVEWCIYIYSLNVGIDNELWSLSDDVAIAY